MLVAQAAELILSSCVGRSGSGACGGVAVAKHVQQYAHLRNCLLDARISIFIFVAHRFCCLPLAVNTQQLNITCNTAAAMEISTTLRLS